MKTLKLIISILIIALLLSCTQNLEVPKNEDTGKVNDSNSAETEQNPSQEENPDAQNPVTPENPELPENDFPKIIMTDLVTSHVLERETDYEFIIPDNSTGWIMVVNVTPDGDDDNTTDLITFDIDADEIKALWNFSDPYTDAEGYVKWDRLPDYNGSVTSAAECARDSANHLIYLEDLQTDYNAMSDFLNILDSLYAYKGGRLLPPDSVLNAYKSTGMNKEPEILFETENQKWMLVLLSDFGENSDNTLGMFSNTTYLVDTPPVIFLNIRAFKDTKETTLDNIACTIIHEYTHFCESWNRYIANGNPDQRSHILSEGMADYVSAKARNMTLSGEAGYIWFWLNEGNLWQPETERNASDGTSLSLMNYGLGAMIYSKLSSMKGEDIPLSMITDKDNGLKPLEKITETEAGTFLENMFLDMLGNLNIQGYEDRNSSYLDSFRFRDIFRLYENSSAFLVSGISEAEFSRTGVHFYKLPERVKRFRYTGSGDCIAFSLEKEEN